MSDSLDILLIMAKISTDFLVALWAVEGIGRVRHAAIIQALEKLEIDWQTWWQRPSKYQKYVHLPDSVLLEIKKFQKKYTCQSYVEFLAESQIEVLLASDPAYPPHLQFLDDHPPVLFYKGNLKVLHQNLIAVVGTRKITSYGQLVTKKIVTELVQAHTTIVSGFMYGVDAMAHKTAHENRGRTVGILGFGFEHMFPSSFQAWFTELLAHGHLFMTEYAPHVAPNKGTFPARNRLIAGLSLGVIVTEAALKSGSHITANWANEYGRSVYAVPGPITNPYAEGTRALINQGALCINSGLEVLEDLGLETAISPSIEQLGSQLSILGKRLYQQLSDQSQTLTQLITATHQSSATLLSELGLLEVMGLIARDGNHWKVAV